MGTTYFFRLTWIALFSLFVIWGAWSSNGDLSPFESTAREYVRLHSDMEFDVLSRFIVPLFCFGFGWCSKEIFSDFADRVFKKRK